MRRKNTTQFFIITLPDSILTDPDQYDLFLEELNTGKISDQTREKLAVAAYSHTANYDTHIANYLENKFDITPTHFRVNEKISKSLRYGENPHQNARIFGNFEDYF